MAFNVKTHGKHRPPPDKGKVKAVKSVRIDTQAKIVDIKPGPFRKKK